MDEVKEHSTLHPLLGRLQSDAVRRTSYDREILSLALPALGALIAEPVFLLADSAIVGHLGTPALAGLGIAATVLATLVNLAVFLAYGTTGAVARLLGAGDVRGALRQGVDGCWLAVLLGGATAAVMMPLTPPIVGAFGPAATDVADAARAYLWASLPGLPAMLLVLAATGVLRGLQDTRTPLLVAAIGALANVGLNLLLVYGVGGWSGLGIVGSALGTVLAQVGMAAAFVRVIARGAGERGVALAPSWPGVRRAFGAGMPLLVRTVAMRIALVAATVAATALGTAELAAHQIAFTTWTFLALALDALAIAAQAMVGRRLGAGDAAAAREVTRRLVTWALLFGLGTGALLVLARPVYVPLFSADPQVRDLLASALLVAALLQPLAAWVFALDGVLIGAGDGRFLAVASALTLLAFLPALALVSSAGLGLTALWWAIGVWMLARWMLLGWRARGAAWLVTGAVRA